LSGKASGNAASETAPIARSELAGPKSDARVLRSRDALGDAMIALMQEQPFESITVQQVLDRAGVSRSTFYSHYRDKDDLFLSDVEDFFQMMGRLLTRYKAPARRLAPVEEFFAHLADVPGVQAAIDAAGKGPDVRELGIGCFARSIEERLTLAGVALPAAELRATSHALAGSLFSLMDWWLRSNKPITPRSADALFHRMAWSGLPSAEPVRS
jgi:AcrR family transcriptional regulator